MTAAKDGHGTGILAGLAAASLMLARRWLLDGPTDCQRHPNIDPLAPAEF